MATPDERPWMELDESQAHPLAPAAAPERAEPTESHALALRRRSFLTLAGISASLAACERLPVRHALPYVVAPEEITPGVATHYASTCQACPAACGLVATVRDGRPVKLEGHPEHPLSGGGLCAFGQGDLRALYDAGRLREPAIDGQAASWEDVDRRVAAGLAELGGRPLVVLSRTVTSPTLRSAIDGLLARWGGRLVELDPDAEPASAALEAAEILHGRPLLPALEIGAADLLVTFATDLLGAGPEPVVHTAQWAARRRAADRPPLRHVHGEGSLSLTGANADERWLATAAERRGIALALLRKVAAASPGAEALAADLPAAAPHAARVDALAKELLAARGRSLVVTATEDLAEALAVGWINRLLGNEGHTLDPERPSLVRRGLDRDLAWLRGALARGEVGALLVLGLDPLDQWPDADAIRKALARVPLTIAVTDRPTATASACQVVAAAHHPLECWSDASPRAGVLSLAQPAVRPLFATRAPLASLLAWSGAPLREDREFLAERWKREVLPAADAAAWRTAVRRGLAPEGAAVAALPAARPSDAVAAVAALRAAVATSAAARPADVLEAELIAEVALRDGSRSHVPWLRELPDPLTRAAWSACARLAPETARSLGVADGDIVRVSVGARSVEMAARVLPGQHPRVIGLPVGYGGRGSGDPVEWNATRAASLDGSGRALRRGLSARVERTDRRERLPLVQRHASSEGRPIVFQVAGADEAVHGAHVPEGRDLWPAREPTKPQWHMVLDLDACTGCSACVVACQAENNIAVVGADEIARNRGMHWLRIDRYFVGSPDEPDVLFEPMMCSQCDHAPCETVCPVAATVHSEDGLNQQVYNRCVGTRYCANNCPYKVRRFNWFDNQPSEPVARMVLNPDVTVRARGGREKCTFCVQRIQAARIAARAAGTADLPEVQTACQQSCPARAIHFGDGASESIASRRHAPRAFQALADVGVWPLFTYLARVRTRAGGAPSPHDSQGGHS